MDDVAQVTSSNAVSTGRHALFLAMARSSAMGSQLDDLRAALFKASFFTAVLLLVLSNGRGGRAGEPCTSILYFLRILCVFSLASSAAVLQRSSRALIWLREARSLRTGVQEGIGKLGLGFFGALGEVTPF